MPTYLCHGFRWHRPSIRVFVVVQNLDEASPEWIVRRSSAYTLLESFYNIFDFLPYSVAPANTSRRARSVDRERDSSSNNNNNDNSNNNNDNDADTVTVIGRNGRSRSRSRPGQPDRDASRTPRQGDVTGGSSSGGNNDNNNNNKRGKSATRRKQQQQQQQPEPPAAAAQPPPPFKPAHKNDEVVSAQSWSAVKLLEEYDPFDLTAVSRPYAYVADYVARIDTGCSVVEEMARYEERLRAQGGGGGGAPVTGASSDEGLLRLRGKDPSKGKKAGGWMEKLRDQLQRGEEIRWYVVVNGDEVRDWPDELPGRRGKGEAAADEDVEGEEGEYRAQDGYQQPGLPGISSTERDKEAEREKLRREFGFFDQTAAATPRSRRDRDRQGRPSAPPDRELPAVKPKVSLDQGGLRPKTPKTGGFRRLFGRAKAGDESPS